MKDRYKVAHKAVLHPELPEDNAIRIRGCFQVSFIVSSGCKKSKGAKGKANFEFFYTLPSAKGLRNSLPQFALTIAAGYRGGRGTDG